MPIRTGIGKETYDATLSSTAVWLPLLGRVPHPAGVVVAPWRVWQIKGQVCLDTCLVPLSDEDQVSDECIARRRYLPWAAHSGGAVL
jgi:hypothetical protein